MPRRHRSLTCGPRRQGGPSLLPPTTTTTHTKRKAGRQALHSAEYMAAARRLYEGLGFRRHAAADRVGASGFPVLAYLLPLQ